MGSKTLLICLLGLIAIQSFTEAKSFRASSSQEKLEKLFSEGKKKFLAASDLAVQEIDIKLTQLKLAASSVMNKLVRIEVDETIENVRLTLEDLRAQAAQSGIDADHCFVNQIQNLELDAMSVIDASKDCLDKKIYSAYGFKSQFSTEATKLLKSFTDLESESRQCKTDKCFDEYYAQATQLIFDSTNAFKKYLNDALTQILSIKSSLPSCYLDEQRNILLKSAAKILETVEACIKESQFLSRKLDNFGVLDIIKKLKELVEQEIKKIQEKAAEVVAKVVEITEAALGLAKQEIEKVINGINKIIEELIQKASAAGKDVTDCIETSRADIDKLKEQTLNDIVKCIKNLVADISQIVTVIVSETDIIKKEVSDLYDELMACSDLLCAAGVGLKATKLLVDIPKSFARIVIKITGVIATATINSNKCTVDNIKQFISTTAPIVETVKQCVADKIGDVNV